MSGSNNITPANVWVAVCALNKRTAGPFAGLFCQQSIHLGLQPGESPTLRM